MREHVQPTPVRHSDEEFPRAGERSAADDPADHRHHHVEALDREPLLPQVRPLQECLEPLHFGQDPKHVDLSIPVNRIRVPPRLDVLHEPVPLDGILHVIQLVADPPAVDLPQAVYRIQRRVSVTLEPDRGGGNLRQVLQGHSVETGVQRRVARGNGTQRIDRDCEMAQRPVGLDEASGGRGGPEAVGQRLRVQSGSGRYSGGGRHARPSVDPVRDGGGHEAPIAQFLLVQQLGVSGVVSVRRPLVAHIVSGPGLVDRSEIQGRASTHPHKQGPGPLILIRVRAGRPDDRLAPAVLQPDSESVGEPVHEVEVCHHLARVEDRLVGPAHIAQLLHIGASHVRRIAGQAIGVCQQGALALVHRRRPPVLGDRRHEFGVTGYPTERRSVMLNSVEAPVSGGDDDGDRLPIRP